MGIFSYNKAQLYQKYSTDPKNYAYGQKKVWDELSPLEKASSLFQDYSQKAKPIVRGMLEAGRETVVSGLDTALRTSPLEGIRNTISGVQEVINRPEGVSVPQAMEKGILESKARPLMMEKLTGQQLNNPDGSVNWDFARKFVGRAMEAPTYVYGANVGAKVLSKGLLSRILGRTIKTLPEAGINTAIQAGEEGSTENLGINFLTNALLMSGVSNVVGEIKLPSQLLNKTISDIETEVGKLTPEQRVDINDALKQGVKSDEIVTNLQKIKNNEITPEEVAQKLNDMEIGITSFRGTPVKTVAETVPYYDTPRAKGFLNSLNNEAPTHNLKINEIGKSTGFYEGNIEPSFVVKVRGTMTDGINYSAKHGLKANQDSVLIFAPNKVGAGTKYVFDNIVNPDSILTHLKKYDIKGATIQNGKLVLYDSDGSLSKNINNFSKDLKYEPITTRGEVKFLEKSEYPQYTQPTGARTGNGNSVPTNLGTPVVGKTAKAATDINKKIVQQGFESLPDEELAKYTPITKEKTLNDVSKVMSDWDKAKAAILNNEDVPNKQVLFNAVKRKAFLDGDLQLMRDLAKSPIATERSLLAQQLGSAGFNNDTNDVVSAIRDIADVKTKAVERRLKTGSVEKTQAKLRETIKGEIKKFSPTHKTWVEFLDNIKCK